MTCASLCECGFGVASNRAQDLGTNGANRRAFTPPCSCRIFKFKKHRRKRPSAIQSDLRCTVTVAPLDERRSNPTVNVRGQLGIHGCDNEKKNGKRALALKPGNSEQKTRRELPRDCNPG